MKSKINMTEEYTPENTHTSSVFEYKPEYDKNSPLPENNVPTFTKNVRKLIELINKS